METKKLEHFRSVLLEQLRQNTERVRTDQAAALEAAADDGVKDSVDMSLQDVNQELMLKLGERDSQTVAEIDEALQRIDEGTFGQCERCGNPIDERRLEALPTARYDAACQTAVEAASGPSNISTL